MSCAYCCDLRSTACRSGQISDPSQQEAVGDPEIRFGLNCSFVFVVLQVPQLSEGPVSRLKFVRPWPLRPSPHQPDEDLLQLDDVEQ